MRIIDRFDKYMNFKGLNDNQVTVNCLLSVGLLGNARRGKSDLGKKAIDKILNFYQDLNQVWLMTGEGEMIKGCAEISSAADTISISSEAWDVIKKQADSLASKDRQMEELIGLLKKANVPKEDNAKCAGASGSDLEK
jgi:hypothetical protein